jgi:RNA polymerase sigma-70 factor (ECF subfamily)
MESDAELVERARRGNRDAVASLIERHRDLLFALCRRTLGDTLWVEDATQEAVLQAFVCLDRLRQPERFGPWLAGIGLNTCRRMLRDAQARAV